MRRTLLLALLLLATAAPLSAQFFTVSGTFKYEDKEWAYSGWTGADPEKPIRRADVTVLNNANGSVLGIGSTAQDGSFSIVCTGIGLIDVSVRCDADDSVDKGVTGFQRVRVTNDSNVEYAVFSPVFPAHLVPLPLDIGTVTALKIISGGKEANGFNMFDMAIAAMEYVTGPDVGAAASTSSVRVYWPGGSGSYASGNGAHIADDDGYDDAVILHELGHVVHNLWSSSDNPAGTHYFGDSDQDPRLSFGEGYATFFNGCVLDFLGREGLYMDANGSSQSGAYQLRLRMETAAPYANDAYGAADEVAVACVLYDLIDSESTADTTPGTDDDAIGATTLIDGKNRHKAWWEVFVGPVKTAANLTLNDAWDGWFSKHVADPHTTALHDLYELRRARFWNDAQEPDNASAAAVPLAPGGWTDDRTLYYSVASPPVPGSGDADWYATDLVVGSLVTFETRYPGGAADADTQADTRLDVYVPSGALAAGADGGGVGRNATVSGLPITQSGTWTFAVTAQAGFRRYGRYNARVRYDFENHVPTLTAGPSATPQTITFGETSLLTATAVDPDFGQTLVWAWTPLDGGSIQGSGQSVTFVPPDVLATTVVAVQLVVTDSLGASTAPVEVQITVEPGGGELCAQPASKTTGGSGKPGLLGVPVLVGDNLPTVPGNSFALHASNALPGATAYLVAGFSLLNLPFDGGTLHPSMDILVPLVVNGSGEIVLPLSVPAFSLYCGLTLHAQVLVPNDPGAAGFKQTAQSNYLSFTFGN